MSEQNESVTKRQADILAVVRDGLETSVCDMERICQMPKDDVINTVVDNIGLMIEMYGHFDNAFKSCKVKLGSRKGGKALIVSYDNSGKESSFSVPCSEGDGKCYAEKVVNGMLQSINNITEGGTSV